MFKYEFALSESELKQFHENGYIGPFDLYDEEEMKQNLKELRPKLISTKNAIYNVNTGLSEGVTNLASYDRHFDIPFLASHITQKKIVDKVAGILGNDVICWRTEFFPKYPGDEGTDWHQGRTFASIAGDKQPQILWPDDDFGGTITVWTAFTDSTIDNGCIQFIPGTHKTMYYDESKHVEYDSKQINNAEKDGLLKGFFGYDFRKFQIDPDWKPDESKAAPMVMKAGQFIIFWSTLLHGSHSHKGLTKDMRLGYAARYVPTCVRVYPYSKNLNEFGGTANLEDHGCVLVSGANTYDHNKFRETTNDSKKFVVNNVP